MTMSQARSERLDLVKSMRKDRAELTPKEEPRDYQYLSLKYGKYLQQETKQDVSPKNPYYSAPEKREDVDDSLGEEDEESGMIDAATSDGGGDSFVKKLKKKRKKKQSKKKKAEEYINILQIVSLIMFMAGALGLISISALRFTTVETQSIHDAILNFYFLFLGIC